MQESERIEALSAKAVDCAYAVHRALGPGLLERVYHICCARELDVRGIPYTSEVPISVN